MSEEDKAKEDYPRADHDYGLSWIRREGKGRVFDEAHGHSEPIYAIRPMLEHVLAGMQYAIGDLKADDSPSVSAKSSDVPVGQGALSIYARPETSRQDTNFRMDRTVRGTSGDRALPDSTSARPGRLWRVYQAFDGSRMPGRFEDAASRRCRRSLSLGAGVSGRSRISALPTWLRSPIWFRTDASGSSPWNWLPASTSSCTSKIIPDNPGPLLRSRTFRTLSISGGDHYHTSRLPSWIRWPGEQRLRGGAAPCPLTRRASRGGPPTGGRVVRASPGRHVTSRYQAFQRAGNPGGASRHSGLRADRRDRRGGFGLANSLAGTPAYLSPEQCAGTLATERRTGTRWGSSF